MKCPQCGRWNKASLPRCFYCGTPLEQTPEYMQGQDKEWQQDLKIGKPKEYISVDDEGDIETGTDRRDALASEMVELKHRIARGEKEQKKLRTLSAQKGYAPSSMSVQNKGNRDTFFDVEDDPDSTLRQVAPELVEKGGEIRQDATHVFTSRQNGYGKAELPPDIPPVSDSDAAQNPHQTYDGFNDTTSYRPQGTYEERHYHATPKRRGHTPIVSLHTGHRRIVRFVLFFLAALIVCAGVVIGIQAYQSGIAANQAANQPIIYSSMLDDMAAHTILIPGTDGASIYIRELHASYIVTSGYATVQVADHTWYDNYEDYLNDTMEVTLTPYLKSASGQQTPLDVVRYDIEIPLSPLEMVSPDAGYIECATTLYSIQFYVRPGSEVSVNGQDYTDLVNATTGRVSVNETIQPIGNNDFTIVVRSQYCRENDYSFTIYRAQQSIPLDLATDTDDTAANNHMLIYATTLPGATVEIVTPYSDLDISRCDIDGSFSFYAMFDHYGENEVTIATSYPGRETTYLSYIVSYVPQIDEYSRKAWGMDSTDQGKLNYNEYLGNAAARTEYQQIYVLKGTVTSIISTRPQIAVINVGTEESPMNITISNDTQTTWVEGTHYEIYADANGTYSSTPWLIARYTYTR